MYDMIHEFFRDLFHTSADEENRRLKAESVNRADLVICISETTRQDALRVWPLRPDQLVVVPLAANVHFRRTPRLEPDRPFVMFVGDRNHYKNFRVLLHAFARWQAREPVCIVVGGAAPSPDEQQLIVDLGLSQRIRFVGRVSDEQLASFYSSAIAYVQTSLYEGFGIPILEALSCGCRVIASDIPASREVAGSTAAYFAPTDPDSLVAALDKAVGQSTTEAQRAAWMARGRQFSWDASASAMLAAYRQVADSRRT